MAWASDERCCLFRKKAEWANEGDEDKLRMSENVVDEKDMLS